MTHHSHPSLVKQSGLLRQTSHTSCCRLIGKPNGALHLCSHATPSTSAPSLPFIGFTLQPFPCSILPPTMDLCETSCSIEWMNGVLAGRKQHAGSIYIQALYCRKNFPAKVWSKITSNSCVDQSNNFDKAKAVAFDTKLRPRRTLVRPHACDKHKQQNNRSHPMVTMCWSVQVHVNIPCDEVLLNRLMNMNALPHPSGAKISSVPNWQIVYCEG